MLRTSLVIVLFAAFFTGCYNKQENIEYTNHFFIIDKRLTLQKEDIEDIKYIKNDEGLYNVDLILKKRGLNKLKYLFKNSIDKHFGMIINNKIIQFNIPIVENIFEESGILNNKEIHFQFDEIQTLYFLKSFDVKFKK